MKSTEGTNPTSDQNASIESAKAVSSSATFEEKRREKGGKSEMIKEIGWTIVACFLVISTFILSYFMGSVLYFIVTYFIGIQLSITIDFSNFENIFTIVSRLFLLFPLIRLFMVILFRIVFSFFQNYANIFKPTRIKNIYSSFNKISTFNSPNLKILFYLMFGIILLFSFFIVVIFVGDIFVHFMCSEESKTLKIFTETTMIISTIGLIIPLISIIRIVLKSWSCFIANIMLFFKKPSNEPLTVDSSNCNITNDNINTTSSSNNNNNNSTTSNEPNEKENKKSGKKKEIELTLNDISDDENEGNSGNNTKNKKDLNGNNEIEGNNGKKEKEGSKIIEEIISLIDPSRLIGIVEEKPGYLNIYSEKRYKYNNTSLSRYGKDGIRATYRSLYTVLTILHYLFIVFVFSWNIYQMIVTEREGEEYLRSIEKVYSKYNLTNNYKVGNSAQNNINVYNMKNQNDIFNVNGANILEEDLKLLKIEKDKTFLYFNKTKYIIYAVIQELIIIFLSPFLLQYSFIRMIVFFLIVRSNKDDFCDGNDEDESTSIRRLCREESEKRTISFILERVFFILVVILAYTLIYSSRTYSKLENIKRINFQEMTANEKKIKFSRIQTPDVCGIQIMDMDVSQLSLFIAISDFTHMYLENRNKPNSEKFISNEEIVKQQDALFKYLKWDKNYSNLEFLIPMKFEDEPNSENGAVKTNTVSNNKEKAIICDIVSHKEDSMHGNSSILNKMTYMSVSEGEAMAMYKESFILYLIWMFAIVIIPFFRFAYSIFFSGFLMIVPIIFCELMGIPSMNKKIYMKQDQYILNRIIEQKLIQYEYMRGFSNFINTSFSSNNNKYDNNLYNYSNVNFNKFLNTANDNNINVNELYQSIEKNKVTTMMFLGFWMSGTILQSRGYRHNISSIYFDSPPLKNSYFDNTLLINRRNQQETINIFTNSILSMHQEVFEHETTVPTIFTRYNRYKNSMDNFCLISAGCSPDLRYRSLCNSYYGDQKTYLDMLKVWGRQVDPESF